MPVVMAVSVFVLTNLNLYCAELYVCVIVWLLSAISAGSFAYSLYH